MMEFDRFVMLGLVLTGVVVGLNMLLVAVLLQQRLPNVCQVLRGPIFHNQARVSINKIISCPPVRYGCKSCH